MNGAALQLPYIPSRKGKEQLYVSTNSSSKGKVGGKNS